MKTHRIELHSHELAVVKLPNDQLLHLVEIPIGFGRLFNDPLEKIDFELKQLLKAVKNPSDIYILTRRHNDEIISFALAIYGGVYIKGAQPSEVMMQLFVNGPTWDGNLVSKSERDAMMDAGLIDRYEGWQWLNERGMKIALEVDISKWHDQRWHKKQTNQD